MAASRYLGLVLLPSLLAFAGVGGYSLGRLPWLANRLLAGVVAGLAGAVGLDAMRLWGYRRGYMPGDLPRQFGRMIAGPQAGPAEVLVSGYAYHALNGVNFGLVYALLGGPVRWVWGLVWGLIVFVMMMISPPMLMTGSGPFLRRKGPGPALVALAAHVVMGALTGGITERIGSAGGQGQPRGLLGLLGHGTRG
jgi:hypothetical protein